MISLSDINLLFLILWKFMHKQIYTEFLSECSSEMFSEWSSEIFSEWSSESLVSLIPPKVAKLMQKFSPSQLGITSESDNIFRIRVVVSDLNSEFRIFFRGRFGVFGQFRIFFRGQFGIFGQFRIFFQAHSEYSDNSEFFSKLIRSIRTIPNYMRKKYGNSSKSSVFSRKYFFPHSEKSEYSELYFPS